MLPFFIGLNWLCIETNWLCIGKEKGPMAKATSPFSYKPPMMPFLNVTRERLPCRQTTEPDCPYGTVQPLGTVHPYGFNEGGC